MAISPFTPFTEDDMLRSDRLERTIKKFASDMQFLKENLVRISGLRHKISTDVDGESSTSSSSRLRGRGYGYRQYDF